MTATAVPRKFPAMGSVTEMSEWRRQQEWGASPGGKLASALHGHINAGAELIDALRALAKGSDETPAARKALRNFADSYNLSVSECGRLLIRLHENFKARQGGGNA